MRNKISNGYESISVELNPINVNIARDFWNAYRMTWVSLQEKEYDTKDEVIKQAVLDVTNNRALPTPKESVKFNFVIRNISRVCLAQITRGRVGWWYNVESQMPEYLNHGVTLPLNISNRSEVQELVRHSQDIYDKLVEEGIPPQDLRYICLHGQQTSLVADTNFAALPGFFAMRTENGLTDELNYVARLMKHTINEAVKSGETDELDDLVWKDLLSQLDTLGYKQKKCLIYDKVFGNTGRYPSGPGVCA